MVSRASPLWLIVVLASACGGHAPLDGEREGGPTETTALAVTPTPCGGHWRAQQLGIQGPQSPGPYPEPRGDVYVNTPMQLIQALASTTPQTIVLAPTTFDRPAKHPAPIYPYPGTPKRTFVTARAGHTLIAAQYGATRLTFGISVPALASGLTIKGVTFDIDHELDGVNGTQDWFHPVTWFTSAIVVWDGATDVTIEDVRVLGNQRLHIGIWAASPSALQIRRVQVFGVRRYGLLIGDAAPGPQPVAIRPVIEDVTVNGVYDHEYEAYVATLESNQQTWGQQLHGIFLATPSDLRRARVRRVAHSGIALGNTEIPMQGALIEHVDVDDVEMSNYTLGTGIYLERQQLSPRIRRFCVGPDVDRGVQIEWGHAPGTDDPWAHCSDPTALPVPSSDVRIRAGVIRAQRSGVYVGDWTRGTRLRNLHFENAQWAAVGAHDNQKTPYRLTNTQELSLTFGPLSGCRYTFDNANVLNPQCETSLPAPTSIVIPPPCP